MTRLFWASALFAALILQSKISILSVTPNLTAMFAYYAGIKHGQNRGMIYGMLIGALEDSVSAPLIGPNMIGKGVIGYLSSFFVSGGIFIWTPLLGMLAASLLTIIDNSVVYTMLGIFDKIPASLSWTVLISIMQAMLNSIAGIYIKPAHAD